MNIEPSQQAKPVEAISIIGLGKLGAPIATCWAAKGYRVFGIDVNPSTVQLINERIAPVYEPGLEELLRSSHNRLVATHDYEWAVNNSQVSFIIVPTPTDDTGGFSLKHVLTSGEHIGKAIGKKSDYHLVVLTSTILPGATEHNLKPALEINSKKKCGVDFGLCYSPEFIALGSAIRDFLNPDLVLIGESDPHSGEFLASLYQDICENEPPIVRMSIVNAELSKLALNSYVTTKIAFANMLARICEKLPGANVDMVTSALGLDSRIGPKYLKGAISYGGPCFPRDNLALSCFARQLGVSPMLAEATHDMNQQHLLSLVELVKYKLPPDGRVGILGITYKPNTDVSEESAGFLLAKSLLAQDVPVVVYDSTASRDPLIALTGSLSLASSVAECITDADVIVIATPCDEFRQIPVDELARQSTPRILIDCWRILDPKRYARVAEYVPLGIGP